MDVCLRSFKGHTPHYPITQTDVTFQEISTDVGLGAPAVKMEQKGGAGIGWNE